MSPQYQAAAAADIESKRSLTLPSMRWYIDDLLKLLQYMEKPPAFFSGAVHFAGLKGRFWMEWGGS